MSVSATPWTAALQAPLLFTISQRFLKLMSIESVMPSNHLILCCSLLLVPSVFPRIRVFSSESALHIRWPKYWSFSFSIILLMNTQGWLPLGLTGLISLLSLDFTFTTRHIHSWASFPHWPKSLSGAISLLFPGSILNTYQPGGLNLPMSYLFCFFILLLG